MLKFNRLWLGFLQDTFDDLHNYLDFAEKLQQDAPDPAEALAEIVETKLNGRHRVYVAGPYSSGDPDTVNHNVHRAAVGAAEVMRRGHFAHCPHTATHSVSLMMSNDDPKINGYEAWMEINRQIIDSWATAICVVGMSPGVERELDRAESLGLTVFNGSRSVHYVTDRF